MKSNRQIIIMVACVFFLGTVLRLLGEKRIGIVVCLLAIASYIISEIEKSRKTAKKKS
jgi:hypothetical protein